MWKNVLIAKLSKKDTEEKVTASNFPCGIPVDLNGDSVWKSKGGHVSEGLICPLTGAQEKKRTIHVNTSNLQSRETDCLRETEKRYRAFHF